MLEKAVATFMAEPNQDVRAFVLDGYRGSLDDLKAAFPPKDVHEVTMTKMQGLLAMRNVGKKRFNTMPRPPIKIAPRPVSTVYGLAMRRF